MKETDMVLCKNCKWCSSGWSSSLYAKCKNLKTMRHIDEWTDPVTGTYYQPKDVLSYCGIVNSNYNCEYFELENIKRKWYEGILWRL